MSTLSVLRTGAGAVLLVNALPHGVSAVQGKPFPSPFADPPGVGLSTPRENAIWSGLNLLAGGLLVRKGKKSGGDGEGPRARVRTRSEKAAGLLGAVGMVLGLTWYFGTYVPSVRK